VIRRGNNRTAIAAANEDYVVLLRTIQDAAGDYGVLVHSYVVMTNHYHLLVTPQRELALQQMMKEVGEQYVRYFNGKYDRIGTLWTGRYRALPVHDDGYGLACLRYIEQNPVRAGMVKSPEEHRWSSYRFHAFGDTVDWLSPHGAYMALGSTPPARQYAYRAICGVPLTGDELAQQRRRRRMSQVSDVSDVSDTFRQVT